jgi:hypothetical protein
VYSAQDVNDITGTINANVNPFTAGKNRIINGDFGVWQRGTSFTNPAAFSYLVDRWRWGTDGIGSTTVFSRQTFTPGTAPVTGYEGLYFLRWNRSVATTLATYDDFYQPIENVQTGAGQTVTLSFWAKADSARTLNVTLSQNFGSGGSAQVSNIGTTSLSLTTSWARYSATISLPSIAGKTVGTGSSLAYTFRPNTLNTTFTFDIWGVQLEAGSTATAFQTATGTIQGELAACQRYYYRAQATANYSRWAVGQCTSSTAAAGFVKFPITMRTAPSSLEQTGTASNYGLTNSGTSVIALSSVPSFDSASPDGSTVVFNVSSGLSAGNATQFLPNGNTTAYLGWSAEL